MRQALWVMSLHALFMVGRLSFRALYRIRVHIIAFQLFFRVLAILIFANALSLIFSLGSDVRNLSYLPDLLLGIYLTP